MTKDEALAFDLALEALENSVDLVREDAYNAEKLYGNYPSRQGKVAGLKVLADDHEKAITAIKQARALDKKAENARELGLDYEPVAWSDTKQSELNDWFLSLPTERQAVLLEDKWMLAGAAFLAGKTTPPAQPAHLAQVVRAHIQDLRACLPTLREHKLSDTAAEVEKAANELEAAAAQPAPVQEPVAWMYELIIDGEVCNVECTNVNWNPEYQPFGRAGIDFVESGKVTKTPLYTTPPAPVPVPLTNTEFGEQWFKQTGRIMGTDKQLLLQAKRVTEAAHGITEKGQK